MQAMAATTPRELRNIWPQRRPIKEPKGPPRVKWVEFGDYRVKKVSAKQLHRIVFGERKLPMLIDFYATWCGPCIQAAQDLEQLAVEYHQKVDFLKVDTDEEYELAHHLGLRGLPSYLFVSKDVEKDVVRTEGVLSLEALRDIIDRELQVEREIVPDYFL